MGKQSLWYFNFYVSFTVLFAVEWIYMLVVTVYYGDSCSKKCPLITINYAKAIAAGLNVTDVPADSLAVNSAQTDYYPCDGAHDLGFTGYCMLEKVCRPAFEILAMPVQSAFDSGCFYCGASGLTGALTVFGPAPTTLAEEKWVPMENCGTEINQGGFTDNPEHILPDDIIDQPASLYSDAVYPGGVGEFTLCWDTTSAWDMQDTVFGLEITVTVFTGVLTFTSLYCALLCWFFADKYLGDWAKLDRCAKISTCLYRRVVLPMQWWIFVVLIIPESILAIYIWVLGTCREVLDLYGNVAFYPLVTAWLALAVLFWLVQCCGGFALRRRYSREPSFEDPVVTATLSANPSGFERCWNSSLCLCLRSTCPKFGP